MRNLQLPEKVKLILPEGVSLTDPEKTITLTDNNDRCVKNIMQYFKNVVPNLIPIGIEVFYGYDPVETANFLSKIARFHVGHANEWYHCCREAQARHDRLEELGCISFLTEDDNPNEDAIQSVGEKKIRDTPFAVCQMQLQKCIQSNFIHVHNHQTLCLV